jgi:hypothetical protein
MPEPIFRSSEGRTPGAKVDPEVADSETSPEAVAASPMAQASPDPMAGTMMFDETAMNAVRPAPAKTVATKGGGCAQSALMTFLTIGIIALGIIAAVVYFIYYSGSQSNGNFN